MKPSTKTDQAVEADRIPGQRTGQESEPEARRSIADRLFSALVQFLDSDRLSRKSVTRQGLILGAFVVAGLVALFPVLREAGWPQNHEEGRAFARTAIYAQHMRHFDFLPVWSDSDAYGMGTPLPAFYQKLFYWIAGGLSLIGWPLKAAVVGTLLGFLLIGMYGMRRLLLRLGTPALIAGIGGVALAFAPYAFTDWYTRGDVAEFSGMMLVPWILCWAVDLVEKNKVSLWIVPLILVTYLAHNLIAFYSLIITGGAFLLALIVNSGRVGLIRRYALAMTLSGLAIAPFLLLTQAFGGDYDITNIVPDYMQPRNNLHPFREYFLAGRDFSWSSPAFLSMTVTIGLALWIALGIVLVWRAGQRLVPEAGIRAQSFLRHPEVFLAGVVVVFMAMQTKAFVGVYELPLLKFTQFPWRLDAFITPALIALVLAVGWRCVSNRPSAALLGAAGAAVMTIGLLANGPVATSKPSAIDPSAYRPARIQAASGSSLGNTLLMIGEYLPVVHSGKARETPETVANTYQQLASRNGGLSVLHGPCQIQEGARTFEASVRTFQVNCTAAGAVALPISYNSVTTIRLAGREIPYHRIDRDPRMIVELPAGAAGKLTVQLPTWWRILTHAMP